MDKNTITGFVLIALILFGFAWWQQPSEEQLEQQRKEFVEDSLRAVKAKQQQAKKEALQQQQQEKAQADTSALFHKSLSGTAQDVVLQNGKLALTLSTKGGTVAKAVIKDYVGHNLKVQDGSKDTKDVTLFEGNDQRLNYLLSGKELNIETEDLYFTPSNVTDSTVTMTAEAAPGKMLTLDYVLGKDYILRVSLRANGLGGLFAPDYNEVGISWEENARQQERGFTFENRYATLTYKKADGGTDHLSEASEKEETTEDALDWVAFKNQFFSAVMISKDNFQTGARLKSTPLKKESHYLKNYQARLKTAFDPTGKKATELEFYYGPNDFRLLQKVEKESAFGKDLEMQQPALRLSADADPVADLDCNVQLRAKRHPAARTEFPVDAGSEHLRSHRRMGHKHLAHRRPPVPDLYPLLRCQHPLHLVHHAAAEGPDGRSASRADEDDAVDDVSHAADVLLHVQRLLVGSQLLLLHLPVLLSSHHVHAAQDYQREEVAGLP